MVSSRKFHFLMPYNGTGLPKYGNWR